MSTALVAAFSRAWLFVHADSGAAITSYERLGFRRRASFGDGTHEGLFIYARP